MKFVLIGLVALLGLGYGGAKAYLHYHVSNGMDSAIVMMAGKVEMGYGGVSSTLTGELTVDDVRFRVNGYRDDIYIGRMGINTPSFLALLNLSKFSPGSQASDVESPEYFGLIAENIRVSTSADYYQDYYTNNIKVIAPSDIRQRGVQCVGKYGYSPEAFSALGYDELVMSTSLILRPHYVAEMDFDIEDMFDIEIDLSLEGNLMMLAAAGNGYQPPAIEVNG